MALVLGVVEVQWAESCGSLRGRSDGWSLNMSSLTELDCSPLTMAVENEAFCQCCKRSESAKEDFQTRLNFRRREIGPKSEDVTAD